MNSLATTVASFLSMSTCLSRSVRIGVVSLAETASSVVVTFVDLVLADERQDVLRGEEVLRVLQHDELVDRDRRVGGEEVGGLHLAVLQRLDGQRRR